MVVFKLQWYRLKLFIREKQNLPALHLLQMLFFFVCFFLASCANDLILGLSTCLEGDAANAARGPLSSRIQNTWLGEVAGPC